jgi:lysophospholipase L1-like esterase
VGYRKPLKDALTAANYQTDFVGTLINGAGAGLTDPEHDGHGACTADELVNGPVMGSTCVGPDNVSIWLNAARPDVVLLHIGTNDLGPSGDQSEDWIDVQSIRAVINTWANNNWPVTVIYARIINTQSATPETTTFNDKVRDNVVQPSINNGEQAILVDQESALSTFSDYGDNLHPNPTGYAKMANVWLRPLTGTGTSSLGDRYPPGLSPGFLPKCP